jgi:hypothetical protein
MERQVSRASAMALVLYIFIMKKPLMRLRISGPLCSSDLLLAGGDEPVLLELLDVLRSNVTIRLSLLHEQLGELEVYLRCRKGILPDARTGILGKSSLNRLANGKEGNLAHLGYFGDTRDRSHEYDERGKEQRLLHT